MRRQRIARFWTRRFALPSPFAHTGRRAYVNRSASSTRLRWPRIVRQTSPTASLTTPVSSSFRYRVNRTLAPIRFDILITSWHASDGQLSLIPWAELPASSSLSRRQSSPPCRPRARTDCGGTLDRAMPDSPDSQVITAPSASRHRTCEALCDTNGMRSTNVATNVETNMKAYKATMCSGITRTKEFERKKLATHAVNVGTKCGHGCTYCSSGALLRMHRSFKNFGVSPFDNGYAIVDPDASARVARDARRMRKRGMIQLCTVVDAWSPEAQEHNLGRRCLEAILSEPEWTVRILTKNAAVIYDFDLIEQHRDRVLVGLSITGTPDKADAISVIEPNASSVTQRMAALWEAHARGLRTYAMFCPLLPGIADAPEQIDGLVRLAVECGVEEIFVEPVNARGAGLKATQEVLENRGHRAEATAIGTIRQAKEWSRYVVRLVSNVQISVRTHDDVDRLRILLYSSRLTAADQAEIRRDDAGVVWLGKK